MQSPMFDSMSCAGTTTEIVGGGLVAVVAGPRRSLARSGMATTYEAHSRQTTPSAACRMRTANMGRNADIFGCMAQLRRAGVVNL